MNDLLKEWPRAVGLLAVAIVVFVWKATVTKLTFWILQQDKETLKTLTATVWSDRIKQNDYELDRLTELTRSIPNMIEQIERLESAHTEMSTALVKLSNLDKLSDQVEKLLEYIAKLNIMTARIDERQKSLAQQLQIRG